MDNARDLILAALDQATEITPAGSSSLLALAARALDPATPITRDGLGQTLGLHPCLVIATLVTADLAGDSEARRHLGRRLFSSLELKGHAPIIAAAGQLSIGIFGLERLMGLEPVLDELAAEVLPMARAALEGRGGAEPLSLGEAEERAAELQRTKIVPMEKGLKTKLGIPPDEATRRRGAQAVRAVLKGIKEPSPGDDLSATVAGEVAACLCLQRSVEAAADFVLGLAALIDGLPGDQAQRPAAN